MPTEKLNRLHRSPLCNKTFVRNVDVKIKAPEAFENIASILPATQQPLARLRLEMIEKIPFMISPSKDSAPFSAGAWRNVV